MDNLTNAATMETDRQPSGPARVGMEMRLVRERLGWRLSDVAAELRIRLPYLEAIERGELSALPGAAYQTGFVRTYAQALGLDGDEILRRFRAEGTGFVPKAELSFLAPVPDRAVPTGAIVLLGVVLVLVGYGLWYRHTAEEAQLAAQIPPVPAELAPLAVPPKPPVAPPAKPETDAAAGATAKPVAAAVPAMATPAGVTPVSAPPAAGPPAATPPMASPPAAASHSMPAAMNTPAASPQAAGPAAVQTAAAPPAQARTIVATADSWVEVQDAKGNILFSKTLHAGDSWPVPDMPGLTMTTGNAGATEIADNGKPGAPLGGSGTVLRKFALTPAAPGASGAGGEAANGAPAITAHADSNPAGEGGVEGPSPTGPVTTN